MVWVLMMLEQWFRQRDRQLPKSWAQEAKSVNRP
jgi:hypothetical protein